MSAQEDMIAFIKTATPEELSFTATLDYDQDRETHYNALRKLIFDQNCRFSKTDGVWYPLEVIELGSHVLQKGHEREFTICTLLVLLSVVDGNNMIDTEDKFMDRASEYQAPPNDMSALILDLYGKLAACGAQIERVSGE